MTELCTPNPVILLESLRSIGYEFETAVADIIDNSIAAGATQIDVSCKWSGSKSTVIISDNGRGMNEDVLTEAMRLGSMHPGAVRDPSDLGRFGMGLKTASLSQCRKFTVVSKQHNGQPAARCWSLDHVAAVEKWEVLCDWPEWFDISSVSDINSGTWVIWEELDRVTAGMIEENESDERTWARYIDGMSQYLEMVFHRFLETGLKINVNDVTLTGWDPFLAKESQVLASEHLDNGLVVIQPYVLPHHSRLTDVQFKAASGLTGWNAHQGFYIYRNKRLLVAGGWLGLYKLEEHCKLGRIMIDLPNSVDRDWQIDIQKANSRPPVRLVRDLRRIATLVRTKALEVYKAKGKRLQRGLQNAGYQAVWQTLVKQQKHTYKINRDHEMLQTFIEKAVKAGLSTEFYALLRVIEETVPVTVIAQHECEDPKQQHEPFYGDTTFIEKLFNEELERLRAKGKSSNEIKLRLANLEPFSLFPHFIETII